MQDPSQVASDLENTIEHSLTTGMLITVGVWNAMNVQVIETPTVLIMDETGAPTSKATC